MRISDWSSDVCSSDLPARNAGGNRRSLEEEDCAKKYVCSKQNGAECRIHDSFRCCRCSCSEIGNQSRDRNDYSKQDNVVYGLAKPSMKETPCRFEQCRSEERRVGKECVRKCRSRWET